MFENRITSFVGPDYPHYAALFSNSEVHSPIPSPEQPLATGDIFDLAWRAAYRDREIDRLFNAWYYEI